MDRRKSAMGLEYYSVIVYILFEDSYCRLRIEQFNGSKYVLLATEWLIIHASTENLEEGIVSMVLSSIL